MKTNKTFVLIGFDHETNNSQYPLFRVMQERGFNIVRHHSELDTRNIRFLTFQNNRPTVVIGVMSDKDREMYFDIPAIHLRDLASLKSGDFDLTDGYTLADLDEIIYGYAQEAQEEPETRFDDEDDDYAPIVFSSHSDGFYGYHSGLEML
ncbi:hypothetical protein A4L30_10660 [Salmonella enterica subsp. enterica serovar Bovismorbificans]|nr:hypothetical protein [Salmonella enterica subsp. enterica serovar Bovismorbificans]